MAELSHVPSYVARNIYMTLPEKVFVISHNTKRKFSTVLSARLIDTHT